ncbi:NAD(P)-binding protein [Paraburkholderia phymatum]|uniref:TrkA-N domain protein n=1 Tax=Paraburkholderia phymatum (strain DSM 17167 / CIP 108236 / LMG 21445 / STM815) TaxID=391038 RepID=B2JWQ5_PARP8|nr:NAD(P)-binding protein [Paraburkholderia phymatum]ACC75382.1 TrkA-N domain protein [Paraburkholderia phymatum STM815]
MWIYRVDEPRLGAVRVREWRRRARHAVALLVLLLTAATTGLILLDESKAPFGKRLFTALWDAANLTTTLGDFSEFNERQKLFMLAAMFVTMLVTGFAISSLTGILSGDDVIAYRENRKMEHKFEHLANHVVVVGYRSLGQRIAEKLRGAGETVLVLVADKELADRAAERGHLVILSSPDVFDDALRHARLKDAKALVVTTPDGDANLAVTLMTHSLNRSLRIIAPGENALRKTLLENAGATGVVIGDEILADALMDRLTAHAEATS